MRIVRAAADLRTRECVPARTALPFRRRPIFSHATLLVYVDINSVRMRVNWKAGAGVGRDEFSARRGAARPRANPAAPLRPVASAR